MKSVRSSFALKAAIAGVLLTVAPALSAQSKPKVSFDEFFNAVGVGSVRIAPDGHSVVMSTDRADWQQEYFRRDLWLYRDANGGSLVQLTQSGHDGDPQWSPDSKWIAFVSDRKAPGGKTGARERGDDAETAEKASQLYLIAADGGEAFPITEGDEDVHAFAWAPDGRSVYFATRQPWTKSKTEEYKKQWKDVVQYRDAERGDQIFQLNLATALPRHYANGTLTQPPAEVAGTPDAKLVLSFDLAIGELVCAPDGKRLGFISSSISRRQEKVTQHEVYGVDLTASDAVLTPRKLTENNAQEAGLKWAADSRHLFFGTDIGSIEGSRWNPQPRLYWVEVESRKVERWAAKFEGAVQLGEYTPLRDGLVFAGRLGTQVQYYRVASPTADTVKLSGWAGTYSAVTASAEGKLAFTFSTLQKPTEVYLAESVEKLASAHPITTFNKLFAERELPQGEPFRWTAADGTPVEGMLIYPPGQLHAKGLKMLTLIHGGPQDSDGDHFEMDWYQWTTLAANEGWLVFQPNYRGSIGYGDNFALDIAPHIVSTPGKDILAGVDELVKQGIADPHQLAIAGYSYGGYMTNWLITQTTRFKAAMTGAGAVEHAANWGNDDTSFDDAGLFGGRPWEQQKVYAEEAALNYIDRVRTPTHMVAGSDDIRVAVLEDYLLDRALNSLGIPSSLLIFPGEGHGLGKNPWHGRIKVREELKWLEKYGDAK